MYPLLKKGAVTGVGPNLMLRGAAKVGSDMRQTELIMGPLPVAYGGLDPA